MLLPLTLLPIWVVCLVIALIAPSSPSDGSCSAGRLLFYCSTGGFLGAALGDEVAWLFVQIACTGGAYSCMHAGIFFGLIGSMGGMMLGLWIGATYAQKWQRQKST